MYISDPNLKASMYYRNERADRLDLVWVIAIKTNISIYIKDRKVVEGHFQP